MKISVVIPVYKVTPRYLRELIDSVMAQKGAGAFEIVVNDDNSGVDYGEVIALYPPALLTYRRNERNLGMVGNWNEAVRRSTGDLVLLAGHDDRLCPSLFASYLRVFAEHAEVVLCSCQRQFIDDQGQIRELKRAVNDRRRIFVDQPLYFLTGREATRLCLRNGNAIGEPSAVMFRRSAYDRVGGYDGAFEHAADVAFNLSMAAVGDIAFINEPLVCRRIHRHNLTHDNLLSGKVSRDRVRLFDHFASSFPYSKEEINSFRAYLLAKSIYDLLRALRLRQWRMAGRGVVAALEQIRFTPAVYMRYLLEIVQGINSDRR